MRNKLVITPELLKEMEANVRNSFSYQSKIEEAKAELLKNKEAILAMRQHIKGNS